MRNRLALVALALLGMLVAGSIGYGAYLASRDSVGLPVTKLEPQPRDLAPTVARKPRKRPRTQTVAPPAPSPPPVTTTDDHGRRSGNSGHGGGGDD
jgi:hypothetical protein